MDNKILIANLKEALNELNSIDDITEYTENAKHLIEKTIKDLEKKPYVKSYQLTAVWSDGVLHQYSNIPPELGKMFLEALETFKKVSG